MGIVLLQRASPLTADVSDNNGGRIRVHALHFLKSPIQEANRFVRPICRVLSSESILVPAWEKEPLRKECHHWAYPGIHSVLPTSPGERLLYGPGVEESHRNHHTGSRLKAQVAHHPVVLPVGNGIDLFWRTGVVQEAINNAVMTRLHPVLPFQFMGPRSAKPQPAKFLTPGPEGFWD